MQLIKYSNTNFWAEIQLSGDAHLFECWLCHVLLRKMDVLMFFYRAASPAPQGYASFLMPLY